MMEKPKRKKSNQKYFLKIPETAVLGTSSRFLACSLFILNENFCSTSLPEPSSTPASTFILKQARTLSSLLIRLQLSVNSCVWLFFLLPFDFLFSAFLSSFGFACVFFLAASEFVSGTQSFDWQQRFRSITCSSVPSSKKSLSCLRDLYFNLTTPFSLKMICSQGSCSSVVSSLTA